MFVHEVDAELTRHVKTPKMSTETCEAVVCAGDGSVFDT